MEIGKCRPEPSLVSFSMVQRDLMIVIVSILERKKPRKQLYEWQDAMEEKRANDIVLQKKEIKERDGFCRRVDAYDGAVITVDGRC